MWWTPKHCNFKLAEGIEGTSVGKLVGHEIDEIEKLKGKLVDEAHHIMMEIEGEKGDKVYAALIPGMGATMMFLRHALLRLTLYNANFDEKHLELAEVQHTWLEVKGMGNDQGHAFPSGAPEWCIGCFVDNTHATSMYWAMGVPVWLVWKKLNVY